MFENKVPRNRQDVSNDFDFVKYANVSTSDKKYFKTSKAYGSLIKLSNDFLLF